MDGTKGDKTLAVKRKFQIIMDIAMTVLLPLLMAYRLIGEAAHEWFGILLFLLWIAHHILHRHWYKNLAKGRYTAARIFVTVIDSFLLLVMFALPLSGMILSKHIFTFVFLKMRCLWRELYICSLPIGGVSSWLYILACIGAWRWEY